MILTYFGEVTASTEHLGTLLEEVSRAVWQMYHIGSFDHSYFHTFDLPTLINVDAKYVRMSMWAFRTIFRYVFVGRYVDMEAVTFGQRMSKAWHCGDCSIQFITQQLLILWSMMNYGRCNMRSSLSSKIFLEFIWGYVAMGKWFPSHGQRNPDRLYVK